MDLPSGKGAYLTLHLSLLEGGSCYPQGFVKEATQADPPKTRAAIPQTNVREEGDDRLTDQWDPSYEVSYRVEQSEQHTVEPGWLQAVGGREGGRSQRGDRAKILPRQAVGMVIWY